MTANDLTTSTPAGNAANDDAALLAHARKRVALKRGFFIHALVFALVNLGLLAMSAFSGGSRGLHFPLWGWGLGLAIHGIVTVLKLQGEDFTERAVAAEVERLKARR